METNDGKDKFRDRYEVMDDKGKKLVTMYITARQFKNAILEEEILILPAANMKENTVLNWGGTKITFRGDKILTRIFPFIVNKSFACEVYLKLLLEDVDFSFKTLKNYERHNLFKLYENTPEEFKRTLFSFYIENYGEKADQQFIETEISNIADVFKEWRYIYEKINDENKVNSGFLNSFCGFLDRYAQRMIKTKYNYDVDKDMR